MKCGGTLHLLSWVPLGENVSFDREKRANTVVCTSEHHNLGVLRMHHKGNIKQSEEPV